jgi:hypothetical protein
LLSRSLFTSSLFIEGAGGMALMIFMILQLKQTEKSFLHLGIIVIEESNTARVVRRLYPLNYDTGKSWQR